MPTYEYACRDCGEHLEVVQSFSDAALTVCGACGGGLRKVFSAAGIIFKGSGYYVTDTRAKSGAPSGGESKSTGTKDADTSGGDGAGSSGSSDEAASSASPSSKGTEAKSA